MEIDGISIKPLTKVSFVKRGPKAGRYDKVLQKLPVGHAFSVKKTQAQNVRLRAKILGIKISARKQDNGLFAISRAY